MLKLRIFYIFVLFILSSCVSSGTKGDVKIKYDDLTYAKGFRVGIGDGFKVIEVKNPWDTSKLLNRYVLVDRNEALPDDLPEGVVVKVPVERVAVTTTVECSLLSDFGVDDKVVAVTDAEFMALERVQEGVKNGKILDLGKTSMPNAELLVVSDAEVMIVSPFQNQNYGWASKIDVAIVECAAYMEQTPLGQAEWVKFHGLFYGKEALADSIFNDTEQKYLNIKAKVPNEAKKPRVLAEKCYGQTWWVASGESYAANMYRDAGADYIWADAKGTGSLGLSFEAVFDVASDADLWMIRYHNPQGEMTYDMLRAENDLYKEFDAFKQKNVYGCNTATNDYYEKATYYPNLVLADLVKVFYPETNEDVISRYYKRVEK